MQQNIQRAIDQQLASPPLRPTERRRQPENIFIAMLDHKKRKRTRRGRRGRKKRGAA